VSGAKGPAQRREFGPWPDKDGAWSIVLEWAEIGGRLELASLSIRPWAGVPVAPITTTTLRQMPIAEWRRELIQRWEQRARDDQAVEAVAERIAELALRVAAGRPLDDPALWLTEPLATVGPFPVLMFSGGVGEDVYGWQGAGFGDLELATTLSEEFGEFWIGKARTV